LSLKPKPIIPRELATQDVKQAVDYYLAEQAFEAATGFIDSLEQAYFHLGQFPATGSLRYSHDLGLPGLRVWMVERYPYLIFYIDHDDHIDIWRVLHSKRDTPELMRAP